MKKILKNNSGITLAALVLTVIIMIIIASIAVYEGKEMIKKSKIQTLQTNMLTIQAKARAYAEEIDAKVWAFEGNKKQNETQLAFSGKKMEQTTISNSEVISQIDSAIEESNYVAYKLNSGALTDMGLSDLESQKDNYIVVYSYGTTNEYKIIDVIYLTGIDYDGNTYYSLSELQKALTSDE